MAYLKVLYPDLSMTRTKIRFFLSLSSSLFTTVT